MFENYTFESLMESTLARVSDTLDKREGSVIYDAIAPAIMELSNAYMMLDIALDEAFADTATYYYLIKRAAERGMYPETETYAVYKLLVTPTDAAISTGDRFALDDVNFTVLTAIEGEAGAYEVQCETAGTTGNGRSGSLLPIEYIEGLETARLSELLIPGEDEEDVETFRERYLSSFDSTAFGGNKADYKTKVNAIDGVAACRIVREWEQGFSPSEFVPTSDVDTWFAAQSASTVGAGVYSWLSSVYTAAAKKLFTIGGTVKVYILASDFSAPSDELVRLVQEELDPEGTSGEGDGTAPIGHVVNVVGVQSYPIDFTFTFVFARGYTFDDVKSAVEQKIDDYLLGLRQSWDDEDSSVIVRRSQIEASLLDIDGIADITETLMNGGSENLTVDYEHIPTRGDVSG